MALAAARVERTRPARDVDDLGLVLRARAGDTHALDQMIRRYAGFVRLKASSYFIAGGDSDDLIQEGLVGLYKAVRDYRVDREASFRSFAELCITRQIITAIKGATRYKHSPLNGYVSFSHTPAGHDDQVDCTLGDALPGPAVEDPARRVIATPGARTRWWRASRAASRASRPACSRCSSRAAPTRRSRRAASATRRRSTTRCSGSSARSACTSASGRCSTPEPS